MDLSILFISFAVGLIIGFIIAFIILRLNYKSNTVPKNDYENLSIKFSENNANMKLLEERVNNFSLANTGLNEKLANKEQKLNDLLSESATQSERLSNSENKIAELTKEFNKEREIAINQQNDINEQKETIAELNAKYHSAQETNEKQKTEIEKQKVKVEELNTIINNYIAENSELKADNSSLMEKLDTQKKEVEELHRVSHLQFEKIANQLLEDKSSKFTEANKTNIESLLSPLKEDINKFKSRVEETYDKETQQRTKLEERVRQLIEQTNKVSEEANNLATALKGNPQKRGNWGEVVLERILEKSGLAKDREFFIQQNYKNDEGSNLRPDVTLQLPNNRIIIIDSKVSLIAYEHYIASEDLEEQQNFLKEHIKSTKKHIDDLSGKDYSSLVNSLEFTVMFIPVEPAYLIALEADNDLMSYAYSKKVVLLSQTNLLPFLKLVDDLWNREKQNKNAKEIVKQGSALYDKLIGFVETFEDIGKSIKKSQDSYDKAFKQLSSGNGNLLRRGEKFKKLGLKTTKELPASMTPDDILDELSDYEIEDESNEIFEQ